MKDRKKVCKNIDKDKIVNEYCMVCSNCGHMEDI